MGTGSVIGLDVDWAVMKSRSFRLRCPRVVRWTRKASPVELTGQLRRSGRSPCRSLREAWAKRRYRAHFVSKLTDADGENSETDTSLDYAHDCGYITDAEHEEMTAECAEIGRMLGSMIKSPDKFLTSDL